MELNTLQEQGTELEKQEEQTSKKNVTELFEETIKLGKYTFRLKKLKGKQLFTLANAFRISASKSKSHDETEEDSQAFLLECMTENYDLSMNSLEFSLDGVNFDSLYVNGICQCSCVEENIAVIDKLLMFVYTAVISFMEISQTQLSEML